MAAKNTPAFCELGNVHFLCAKPRIFSAETPGNAGQKANSDRHKGCPNLQQERSQNLTDLS